MPKENKKFALKLGIQTYQILTNDDEVCIPSSFQFCTIETLRYDDRATLPPTMYVKLQPCYSSQQTFVYSCRCSGSWRVVWIFLPFGSYILKFNLGHFEEYITNKEWFPEKPKQTFQLGNEYLFCSLVFKVIVTFYDGFI